MDEIDLYGQIFPGGTAVFGSQQDIEQPDYKEPDAPVYYHSEYRELLSYRMTDVSISDDKTKMRFVREDGWVFEFHHEQECCERVEIIDVVGDLDDLVGAPIYMAEEVTYKDHDPDGVESPQWYEESNTWTFYKFATVKGYVTVRWYGSSNGYYSEDVDVRSYRLLRLQ